MRKHEYTAGLPPSLHSKVSVEDNVIGQGKIDLLRLVGLHGSISGAAKEMGLAYRRAWFLLETLQLCFEEPLFITVRGGSRQGGTTLTPLGEALLAEHDKHLMVLKQSAAPFLGWVNTRKRVSLVEEDG